MRPGPDPWQPLLSADGLASAALALFVLFATVVGGVLVPLQVLEPTWQLKLASTLISTAPFPLIGLALLQTAAELGPHDPRLQRRHRLCARLAVGAALGFVLLCPLQILGGLRQHQLTSQGQNLRIADAERRLAELRAAVVRAGNGAELNSQLKVLQGPVLGPTDLALPLLKAEVGTALDQAELQIARRRQVLPPANPWRLLPDLLRNAFACLALALGFAGLARRRGAEQSLLQELRSGWPLVRTSGAGRVTGADAAYLRQISGEADD